MQSLARALLETSYAFMMTLMIHTGAEISIVGGVRGGLWETIHVGHTDLQSSKNVEKNLVLNV